MRNELSKMLLLLAIKDTSFNVGSRYVTRHIKIDSNEFSLQTQDTTSYSGKSFVSMTTWIKGET